MRGLVSARRGVLAATTLTVIAAIVIAALPAIAAPTWTVATDSTNPPTSELTAVDCVSATQCFAVGYRQVNDDYRLAIERGSGSSWSKTTSPEPSGKRPSGTP